MRKLDTRQIGESTYQIQQLPVVVAGKGALRLAKVLGPAVFMAQEDALDKAAIFSALMGNVSDADLEWYVSIFEPCTKLQLPSGQAEHPISVAGFKASDAFDGELMHLFEWLIWCLLFNFSDFLDGKRIVSAVASQQTSAKPST